MKKTLSSLLTVLVFSLGTSFALTNSRSYSWTFSAGNQIPNWSFENSLEFWTENPGGGLAVDSRYKATGSEISAAKTGSFVAKISGTYGGPGLNPLLSSVFPTKSSTAYTLSFYYRTTGSPSSVNPLVYWYESASGSSIGTSNGSAYSAQSAWTLYVMTFTSASNANFACISMAGIGNGQSGNFYFDDVVLEEGTLDTATVSYNRRKNAEAVNFTDAFGRVDQSQIKATTDGNTYLVQGPGFDDFGRPETTFAATPYAISTPTLQTSLLSGAQSYYNSSGPFNAKGYPFSRVTFADEPGNRVLESGSSDSAWQQGKGHTVKQDFYFVQDSSVIPSDIENPTTNNAECKYRLDWVKSQDSSYSLTWTNRLGHVVRTARNITRSASGANTWKWAATKYDYFPSGEVKKTYTPIDDSAGGSTYSEVSEFDSRGQTISTFSPDRNLRKAWYNRLGQLRFSQTEEQRSAGGWYTFYDYDYKGRLISEGEDSLASLPQDSVDKDSYHSASNKIEQIGYIYDDTASFQSRTGYTLPAIMGGWQYSVNITNAPGRLFCKYNKNQDNTYSKFTAKDKFVADFFSYDSHGNVSTSWKYIGAVRDTLKRLQDMWYTYDAQDRILTYANYTSANEYTLSNSQAYYYDHLSRVTSILGLSNKPLAAYTYANWGPLSKVALGGTSTGDSATNVEMFYHSQGGVKEIRATGLSSHRIFQQFLGYENKAFNASGNPSLSQAKFDGSIAQQTYKFTYDMNAVKPVRAVNYNYDLMGRMSTATAYLNTNSTPVDASNDTILTSSLTMAANDTLSSLLEYDLNGRIKGQRSAGVSSADSAKYSYYSNSYKLDHVTGKLSTATVRDASASGTFVYDTSGALVQDKSKKLTVKYGWDGLPEAFQVDSVASKGVVRCCTYDADGMPLIFKVSNPSMTLYNFFDADGNRVSRVEVESKTNLSMGYALRGVNYVYMGPGNIKEWDETYWQAGRVKTSSATVSLMGVTAQIGRIRPDGQFEFFVKSSNGSTMLTVDDRGRYNTGTQRAYDYLAMGPYKLLKVGSDTTDVKQKYEGKEYELLTGLYSFGARWQDPELGMWMSPDPRSEYFNPYSYVGGNPINQIDPNGESDLPPCPEPPYDPESCQVVVNGGGGTDPNPDFNPVEAAIVLIGVGGSIFGPAIASGLGDLFSSHDDNGGSSTPSVTLPEQKHNVNDVSHGLDPAVLKNLSPAARKEYIDRYMAQGGDEKNIPINEMYGYLWNKGNSKIEQATTWQNGDRYVTNIPGYLSGYADKVRALTYYGEQGVDPNQNTAVGVFTADGPGEVGELASSRALGRALEADGFIRPAESAAHHIVAGDAAAAAPARAILNKFGIGINDAENGVFLPANKAAQNMANAAVHSTIHSKAYFVAVNEALGAASNPDEAKAILDAIRKNLQAGGTGY